MKSGKKLLLAVITALAALVIVVGVYFWYSTGKPLYEPGMLKAEENLRGPLTPPEQMPDGDFWRVEADIRLSHFSAGSGENILVVHGGPGAPDAEPWRGLENLTGKYRIHYYAQRGCGRSSRPFDKFPSSNFYKNLRTLEKTLGIGAQLADIERIRQILGEEKLTLIGHSFGGFLAALYAAEFPERVKALVLVAPADVLVLPAGEVGFYEAVGKKLPPERQAEFAAYLGELFDFKNLFSKSESDLVRLQYGFSDLYKSATRAQVPSQGEPGGWVVHALFFSMGKKHDYREALKSVGAPVLVVHGRDDLQTEAASRRYADALRNSTVEVIPASGHFPFHEQPERFGRIIEAFLRRVSTSG